MKKILSTLVILFAASYTVPAVPCSQESTGQITGGACSIKELNRLEKQRDKSSNLKSLSDSKRDLRPIKSNLEISNPEDGCLFGMCLYRHVLNSVTSGE